VNVALKGCERSMNVRSRMRSDLRPARNRLRADWGNPVSTGLSSGGYPIKTRPLGVRSSQATRKLLVDPADSFHHSVALGAMLRNRIHAVFIWLSPSF
jgi:hypothetical protein